MTTTAWSDANQCYADRYQNGDLDFDGLSYQRSAWPTSGNPNHPTSAEYVGPFQANGQPYPQVQYETDIGGSSFLCNTATGAGCTVPPISASFYPYWSLSGPQGFALGSYHDLVRVELRPAIWPTRSRTPAGTPSTGTPT